MLSKSFCVISFLCFSLTLNAQVFDSLVIQAELDSLDKVTVGHLGKVEYDQMFLTIDKALERCAHTFGKSSIPYAKILNRYGSVLTRLGKYAEADSIFTIAEDFWENQENNIHEIYGSLMDYKGTLYTKGGKFEEAAPMFETSLRVLKQTVGTNHTKYAHCLNSYGIMNYHMGELKEAKRLWEGAMAIWKVIDGEESVTYSAGLHNLGNINTALSRYEDAEKLFKEAVRIRKKILNENDPQYGISILNLGTTYARTGKRALAEPLINEAIRIFKTSLGENHPFYLDCLNNFAVFYGQMGAHDKAIEKQKEVLRIQEESIGKDHHRYAKYLTNLAVFYNEEGNHDAAIQSLDEALSILNKNPDENKFELFFTTQTLGETNIRLGNLEKAESYFLKVKEILTAEEMEKSIDNANNLYALGELYTKTNQVEKGIEYLEESKSLFLEIHGVKETDYGAVVNQLAHVYTKEGYHMLGEIYFKESQSIAQELVIEAATHLSEKEMEPFLVKFNQVQRDYLSIGRGQAQFASMAYDNALFYKGYLLHGVVQRNLLLKKDTSYLEDYLQLKSVKRTLAAEYSKPANDREPTIAYEEEADSLEKSLLRNVVGLKECQTLVNWQDVQHNLDEGSVAIEFVHFNSSLEDKLNTNEYGAMVIRGDKEVPQYVPLFSEDQMLNPKHYEDQFSYIDELYNVSSGDRNTLYNLIYKPLESSLEGITNIYYSPTGVMHRLNLSAINIDDNLVFADKYNLIRLGSTRQLVINNVKKDTEDNTAMLFGGIDYEYQPLKEQNKNTENSIVAQEEVEVNSEEGSNAIVSRSIFNSEAFSSQDSIRRKESWPYLNWTQVELDAIELVLEDAEVNTQVFKGQKGSEEAFKSIGTDSKSPNILHIATHGYFFENVKNSNKNSDMQPFKTSNHSMIRSGLVMARGNYAWGNGAALNEGSEDGILTAYEISQVNLSNTKLAVLSACETGLGDIKETEGVYGLQRAFKVAGVDKIIMSLWQVPDFHTQELMSSFYYNWQIEEMSISNAFKSAQNSIKSRYPEAFYWAGFVLVE